MPKTVFLLGTAHSYQVYMSVSPKAAATLQLRDEIVRLCRSAGIVAIVDEMNKDGLRVRRATETAGTMAAGFLHLPHLMCDLTNAERDALNIRCPTDIRLAFEDEETNKTSLAEKIWRLNGAPRERVWLERMQAFDKWPCLVVCGAGHIETFGELLKSVDIEVVVAHRDWAPA